MVLAGALSDLPWESDGNHPFVQNQSIHSLRFPSMQELGDLPRASADDFARQRAWEVQSAKRRAGSAAIEGDAPAAGDGM